VRAWHWEECGGVDLLLRCRKFLEMMRRSNELSVATAAKRRRSASSNSHEHVNVAIEDCGADFYGLSVRAWHWEECGGVDLLLRLPPLDESTLMQELVAQFLAHDGYVDTARAFAEEVDVSLISDRTLNLSCWWKLA
jgi:hypothetical protein